MTKIVEKENKLYVYTPYLAAFVSDIKERLSDRKWNSEERAWITSVDNKDVVVDLLQHYFGYSEDNVNDVTIQITSKESISNLHDSVRCANIPVAKAYGRDSGAKVCDNVTLISGKIGSGGSVKNWRTSVDENTTFKIINFPESAIKVIDEDDWSYTIIEEKSEKEKLELEKEMLLKRLTEIENKLNSL